MSNNKRLYQKYIKNECNDSDLRRMSKDLQEFGLEDNDRETLRDYDADIDQDLSSRLFSNVQHKITEPGRNRRRKAYQMTRVVLVLGLLIGIGWLIKPRESFRPTGGFTENKTVITNGTDTIAILHLPDGSTVNLMPHSHISYTSNFNIRERNIYLAGDAIFSVSKDPKKPFNVFTGRVVTTAIGTKFKIAETKKNIFVKLLEGKIVVQESNMTADRHFLIAGNSINYNIENGQFTSVLRTAKKQQAPKAQQADESATQAVVATEIKLDNEPLSEALDQIAQRYGVEIEYAPADVDNINIIASLDPSKPVYRILHNIALMNHLRIQQLGDRQYIIDKEK